MRKTFFEGYGTEKHSKKQNIPLYLVSWFFETNLWLIYEFLGIPKKKMQMLEVLSPDYTIS